LPFAAHGAILFSRRSTNLKRYLFVDYENINLANIGSLSATDLDVWVFVGPHQKNLPIETVKSLLSSANKPQIVQITKQGKNSLDFHICYELGALSREVPKPDKVYVLSNDKGYDSVVQYAATKGLVVERITELPQVALKKSKGGSTAIAELIMGNLGRIQGNQRPRKKATLRSYLANQFKKTHSPESIDAAIEQLLASGRLKEEQGKLKYDV
jgi:hypothetical protein